MEVIPGFFPVILFLLFLYLLDNFKLVRFNTLLTCLLWGVLSAVIAIGLNTAIAAWLDLDFNSLSKYAAPIIEESLKALVIFYLISSKRIGFMVDAAIYGFAAGAGFALVENIYYLLNGQLNHQLAVWIIRGFGTALMHGGCTALLAVFLIGRIARSAKTAIIILQGMLIAILLHAAFNQFLLNPLVQTLAIMVLLPALFLLVFRYSNARLQQWMELEFNSEVELLSMIRKGEFRSTKAGNYLMSVKAHFSPETIVEMLCYIGLYLELSIKAKRNLMLKENGFPIMVEEDLESKLAELAHLRKQIGPLGEMSLAPLIRMNYRTLWTLNQLKS
jgi:protease PrsW